MQDILKIRAHHGMCLAFFQGKGYSSAFTHHMAHIKADLKKNPQICIIDETDDICFACPHNYNGHCISDGKVKHYDHLVLKHCHIDSGACMSWEAFETLIQRNIFDNGKRSHICQDCQWNDLC